MLWNGPRDGHRTPSKTKFLERQGRFQPVNGCDAMILKTARKLVVAVIGGTALLLGAVMLVTPGPGIIGILAGLAILATEFIWARTLLKRMKRRAAALMPGKSDPGATRTASTAAGGSPPSPICRP